MGSTGNVLSIPRPNNFNKTKHLPKANVQMGRHPKQLALTKFLALSSS